MGNGFICQWSAGTGEGIVQICSGDFANQAFDFVREQCDAAVQNALDNTGDIALSCACPPPAGAILVRVTFDIQDTRVVVKRITF